MNTEERLKKLVPEIMALFLIAAGSQVAVQIAPNKMMAVLYIPIVCILYIIMKWEAITHENKTKSN